MAFILVWPERENIWMMLNIQAGLSDPTCYFIIQGAATAEHFSGVEIEPAVFCIHNHWDSRQVV